MPMLMLINIAVYNGVTNAIFCSLNFLFCEWRLVYSERLVAAFSENMTCGQMSCLTVKWELAYLFVDIFPWCVQFCIKLQKHGQCKGEGKKCCETVFEFCRRTLHARLQTGPGGGSEQSELPLTNFCLLVDFLLDIVSLVRIALFVANTGILYIYSLQKNCICFINCFSWKYIPINWWTPLE